MHSGGQDGGAPKKGLLVLVDGQPHEILDCIKEGSQSTTKTKLRNLSTGAHAFKKLAKGTTLEYIRTQSAQAAYAYYDEHSGEHVFIDCESCEEVCVRSDIVREMGAWLTEGTLVDLSLFQGKVIDFGFASEVIEEVVAFVTPPNGGGKKGKGSNKNLHTKKFVRLSNGASAVGPPYLEIGDKVVTDPKTGRICRRL